MGKADDDLIQRLKNAHENSQQRIMGSNIFGEVASALEARDAEIARLKANVERLTANPADHRYWEGRYRDAESRISDLERQLAEETERCGSIGEQIDGGLQLLLAAVHADDPKREILVRIGDLLRDAAAIRGGAK